MDTGIQYASARDRVVAWLAGGFAILALLLAAIGLYGVMSHQVIRRRQELEQQRDSAMAQALGSERFQAYQLNQDPLFRSSRDLLARMGAPAEKLIPLYEINQTTALEQQRIRTDPVLTPEQRTEALHAVQASRENTLRRLFGFDAYERYLQEQSQ